MAAGGSSSETKAPPPTASSVWTASRDRLITASRSAPSAVPAGGVLDVDSHLEQARRSRRRHAVHPHRPSTRSPRRTARPTISPSAVASSSVLRAASSAGYSIGWSHERDVRHRRPRGDRARHRPRARRPRPTAPTGPVDIHRLGRLEVVTGARLDGATLHLQAADPDREPGVPRGSTSTSVRTDARSDRVGRHRRRDEHTELPPELVLAGRGAVRVEDVALVEHRIGDGSGGGETGRPVTRPPRRPPSAGARRPPPTSAAPAPP